MPYKFNPTTGQLDITAPIASSTVSGTVLQREFNIRSYGAVGDGTTDDLSAIQGAINAAQSAGGGIVFIPKGIYIVSGIPTITGSNITVQGTGDGSKILLASAALNASGTTIGIWVNGGSNITIRDLCIDGNYANIAKNGTYQSASSLWTPVISKYGSTSVKVYKQAGSGIDSATYLKQRMPIRITDAQNVTVENCLLQNSISAGVLADSASVNGCTDILVTNNRIKYTWDNGVYFHQGVQYGTAVNNEISDTTYNGVSAVYCDHIIIANNNIRFAGPSDSDSGGIQINGSSNSLVTGNSIDQCQFYGIDLLSTQETNITGGAGGNSIWSVNTVVSANAITGCHANDYPSHNAPGINLFGAENSNIVNNSIDDCDFGISLGSHATNSTITNNHVSNCSSIGVNIGNSADVINTIVKSNYIGFNGSHGVFAYAPARYETNTIIGNTGMGISLAEPPSGLPRKTDYIIGNTIMDNTDSGVLTNGQSTALAIIEDNVFGNSYGTMFTDGSATNASTTFTSASASFAASDVGLPIFLINQGPGDTLTTTTIASVTNSTTVVLSAAAAATQTGLTFFIARGQAFYSDGTVSGNSLSSSTANFISSDNGKFISVFSTDTTPKLYYSGTISAINSTSTITLGSTLGSYSVYFVIDRNRGQQARAINNYNGYPVYMQRNTVLGTPEYLGAGGTVSKVPDNIVDTYSDQDVKGVKTFSQSTGAGAVKSRHLTVLPNPGRSSSASIFLDNENGQVWEFYNNSSGSFGVYNGTLGNQPVTVQSDAQNGGLTVDQYGLITNGRLYVNGTVQNVTAGTGAKDAVNRTQLDTGGWVSAPATASSTGTTGQKAYDSGFLYVCVAANTWKRVALATF